MANISLYELDGTIDPNDKVIGTDGTTGADQGKTKNYTIAQLGAYINALGVETVTTTDGTFIELTPNSPTIGQVVVTADLSATGTPTATTGLRGDNTWGELGFEAINEGGRQAYLSTDPTIGYRKVGANPDKFGNIGEGAIELGGGFSGNDTTGLLSGATISAADINEMGATGPFSLSTYTNNIVNSPGAAVFGGGNIMNGGPNIETAYFVGGLTAGNLNESYGLNYYNAILGYNNSVGDRNATSFTDSGFNPNTKVQYWSLVTGMKNEMRAGYGSAVLGFRLLSGAPFCATVGIGNVDETLTDADNLTNTRNNLNPRFVVGCGTFSGNTASNADVSARANGFVVMSDGTSKFPTLTNALIDSAGDDSAVTKGWVTANAGGDATTYSIGSSQPTASYVDIILSHIDEDTVTLLGTESVRLVPGTNINLADNASNEVTITSIVQAQPSSDTATAENVGLIRYRSDANNSYAEMVMQTGASTYAWVIIQQNSW